VLSMTQVGMNNPNNAMTRWRSLTIVDPSTNRGRLDRQWALGSHSCTRPVLQRSALGCNVVQIWPTTESQTKRAHPSAYSALPIGASPSGSEYQTLLETSRCP